MIVKILEYFICLITIISRGGSLSWNQLSQMANATVVFTRFIVALTFSADQIWVRTFSFKMHLQRIPCHLYFLTGCACNLFFRTNFSMIHLLSNFKWLATTSIRAINNSKLAFLENMISIIFVRNSFCFASIINAIECSSVKHGLLNWMQLSNSLYGFMAVFACSALCLAGPANKLVTFITITSFNCCTVAICTNGWLNEHRIRSVV